MILVIEIVIHLLTSRAIPAHDLDFLHATGVGTGFHGCWSVLSLETVTVHTVQREQSASVCLKIEVQVQRQLKTERRDVHDRHR